MGHTARIVTLALAVAGLALASSLPTSPVTVILRVDGSVHSASLSEMKAELREAMAPSGVSLEFRDYGSVRPEENFADLIMVKLSGHCQIDPQPWLLDERGPNALGYTHTTDGEILSFCEVTCKRVATSVKAALSQRNTQKANKLLGRALGRVLAHEFYHILARTREHGDKGISRWALSGDQLIGKKLKFDAKSSRAIRSRMGPVSGEVAQSAP